VPCIDQHHPPVVFAARLDQGRLGDPYRGVGRFSCHGGFRQELRAEIFDCNLVEFAHHGFAHLRALSRRWRATLLH
jgi:hypothetical protein